ncbi:MULTISPECIES: hypothetical protein [unclassified Desulfovibrio]|uniref:hypothetical protein n=1 Tax=unclassified Desulfovibrio TaxID=2593640 RepID=UPI000F5E6F3C|nr:MULTISPECIES: hypothetical protein [unclassified Desulfovibrio]RRD72118.1 hypothetical protein EII24_00960 [Desulfovibrio sp. OH1209_COT-279]RRD88273.1 hypothetical protein EII23_00960 [Desulfovibrio sp. OH1186_COT-070]
MPGANPWGRLTPRGDTGLPQVFPARQKQRGATTVSALTPGLGTGAFLPQAARFVGTQYLDEKKYQFSPKDARGKRKEGFMLSMKAVLQLLKNHHKGECLNLPACEGSKRRHSFGQEGAPGLGKAVPDAYTDVLKSNASAVMRVWCAAGQNISGRLHGHTFSESRP